MKDEEFDFTLCEQRLTDVGSIQNYGALAWISRQDHKVHYVSENLPDIVGSSIETIDSGNGKSLVGSVVWSLMLEASEGVCKDVSFSDKFTIIFQVQTQGWLVEWLPEMRDMQPRIRNAAVLIASLTESEAIEEVLKRIVDESGFERAMLYQFLPDDSGEVIAEISGEFTHYCMWFRSEVTREVIWGSKVSTSTTSLSPHNSFGAWKEQVTLHSEPWESEAILTAETVLARRYQAAC